MAKASGRRLGQLGQVALPAVLIGLSLSTLSRVGAQPAAGPPPCDSGTIPTRLDELKVVKRCTVTTTDASGQSTTTTYETTREAGLGQHVLVLVSGLARFRAEANSPLDWSRVVLVIDGQPLKGVTPLFSDVAHSHLEFVLKQDATNRSAWTTVLGGAVRDRAVPLSVAFDGQPPLQSDVDDFELIAIPTVWAWTWIVLFAFTGTLLFWAARHTNLLRDVGPEPPAVGGVAQAKPFSLARTQMAMWFFVVLASYVFIWLVTGTLDTLTSSVLGLTGISAATAVAGNTIDARNQGVAAPPPAASSDGFFTDILSDGQGVSLARVQIAIWTLVLIIVFVRSVWRNLAMPEFDATLLGLMGISNGTYVGFKGLEP